MPEIVTVNAMTVVAPLPTMVTTITGTTGLRVGT